MTTLDQLRIEPSWQKRRELVRQATDVAELLRWLPQESEGWVRAALATRLGELGGVPAQVVLQELAGHDPSALVRKTAQDIVAPPLKPSPADLAHQRDQLLQNPDFTQRALLARALGKQGTPEARQALVHALGEEPEPVLCLGIVRALASWGDREVLLAISQAYYRVTISGIRTEIYKILQSRLMSLPLAELEAIYLEETDLNFHRTCFSMLEQRGAFQQSFGRLALEREEAPEYRFRLIQALATPCDDDTRALFLTLLQRGEPHYGCHIMMYKAVCDHYPQELIQALPPPSYDDFEEIVWE